MGTLFPLEKWESSAAVLFLISKPFSSLLSAQAVQSAPVGLATTTIAAASAASSVLSSTSTLNLIMASTKAKVGLAAVLAASVATPLVLQHQAYTRLRDENSRLRGELAVLPTTQATSPDRAEFERLRGEHLELIQLRGQVAQLRRQVADQTRTAPSPAGKGRDQTDNTSLE